MVAFLSILQIFFIAQKLFQVVLEVVMQLRGKFSVKIKNKKSAFFHSLRISKKKEFRKHGVFMYIRAWKYLLNIAYSFYLKCLVEDANNLSKLYFFFLQKACSTKKTFSNFALRKRYLGVGKTFLSSRQSTLLS